MTKPPAFKSEREGDSVNTMLMRFAPLVVCVLLTVPKSAPAQDAAQSDTLRTTAEQALQNEALQSLVGSWEGTCRTWFEPGKLADESKISGTIRPILDGRFIRHEYEATIQGRPRHGEELIARNAITKRFQVSWVDDFHMNYAIMFSEGEATENGFAVIGHYDAAADAPPWGWKTVFEVIDADHLTITAYNITPHGQEAMAVETTYRRVKR